MATHKPELVGVIGFFDDAHSIIPAMEKVRDANYQSFDAYTPFPVHGLEAAQGLKRSPLPFVTLFAGLTGFCCAFALEYWTSAVDWPLNVGGKPLNPWPAFVPILFELTVLFAALSTVGAMFALSGLPNLKKKSFDPSLTRNRFAIVIDSPAEPKKPHGADGEENFENEPDEEAVAKLKAKAAKFKAFNETEAKEFLKKVGATEVRSAYAEGWF